MSKLKVTYITHSGNDMSPVMKYSDVNESMKVNEILSGDY